MGRGMTEERREPGAWIGQAPDENTAEVERTLHEDAERVAVTNNTAANADGLETDTQPAGHREPGNEK